MTTFLITAPRTGALDAARGLAALLQAIDRDARREARSLARPEEYGAIGRRFWEAMRVFAAAEDGLDADELAALRAAVREELNPWFLRSRYWNRAYLKPHGYAGDFRMLEWIYDLERGGGPDATQPAVVNVLDQLFATLHSARAVWHRRAWFARLVRERAAACPGRPLRVLDVACGGSRYLRDALAAGPLEVTFVDQDPAALAFVGDWLPAGDFRLLCTPVRRLPARLSPGDAFDVVISTGLFDYLADDDARVLLAHLRALAAPDGVVAICNFAPQDSSRAVKDWICDWPLIYRSAEQVRGLFAPGTGVRLDRSPDGALVYASV